MAAALVDEGVLAVHVSRAPLGEGADDHAELPTLVREVVFRPRRMLGVELAGDEPLLLHQLEPLGEQVRRDALQRRLEILELAVPAEEVANDEQRPALADHLEGFRDGTRLTIASGHGPSVPSRASKSEVTMIFLVTILGH